MRIFPTDADVDKKEAIRRWKKKRGSAAFIKKAALGMACSCVATGKWFSGFAEVALLRLWDVALHPQYFARPQPDADALP